MIGELLLDCLNLDWCLKKLLIVCYYVLTEGSVDAGWWREWPFHSVWCSKNLIELFFGIQGFDTVGDLFGAECLSFADWWECIPDVFETSFLLIFIYFVIVRYGCIFNRNQLIITLRKIIFFQKFDFTNFGNLFTF